MRSIVFIGAFMLTATLVLSSPINAEAKKMQFRFGFDTNPKVGGGTAGVLAEKYINESCAGEIEAKFFPNAVMGTDPEMIDKTRMGALQGVIMPIAVLGTTIPYTDSLVLPFVVNSWEKAETFLDSPVSQEFLKGVESYGFKGMGFCTFGLYGLELNKEARTLEEISKLKFRVAPSPILLKTFKALDIEPMVIQFPDLYESLKQGVVDGCDLPPNVAVLVKYTEVIKYFVKTGHTFGLYMFMVNKGWYDKIPDDVRVKFDAAIDRACREHWEGEKKAEQRALEIFEEKGIQTIDLPPEEMQKFVDATKSVVEWRLGEYDAKGKAIAEKVFEVVNYQR
ncbi:TRAP transporter substrate-binding protein [Desulfosarcina widdelii]|nr:TRAP transporter substrate-binding protein [Desulfosarcina widdelii]